MKNIIKLVFSVTTFLWVSCVSPPEYSDGLIENNPAIVNEVDYFSFSILADGYTKEKKWDLNMALIESDILLSTLIIKDLSITSADSSFLYMINDQEDTVLTVGLFNEMVWSSLDSVSMVGIPKKVFFSSDNLSGRVEYQILKR